MPNGDVDRAGTLPLFLYGTLRPGGERHDLVAPWLMEGVPARVWGRLYHVAAGYPALDVPRERVIAHGTTDSVADAALARDTEAACTDTVAGDWGWVYGDVVMLAEPERSLPPIDDYEDFRPGTACLYDRVLIAAITDGGPRIAWTYVKTPDPEDIPLPGGRWSLRRE